MSIALCKAFKTAKEHNRPAFIASTMAGYPTPADTVEILLSLEKGGADIIELGIPLTDALAGGPITRLASVQSISQGTEISTILKMVRDARSQGLKIPIVLMGYYNSVLAYGEERLVEDSKGSGVNGYVLVDLPPEESHDFRSNCYRHGLSYIPFVAATTTDRRIGLLSSLADTFIYVLAGPLLKDTVSRIRKHTTIPLAVQLDVSSREQFLEADVEGVTVDVVELVSKHIGSNQMSRTVEQYVGEINGHIKSAADLETKDRPSLFSPNKVESFYQMQTRFGKFGGAYVPEILVDCLSELERCFVNAKDDPRFETELESYHDYISRPSQLQLANRLTEETGGARIWLKREDLNHTGSHKINNAVGQILLARRLGKRRIVAETGAGQHGVATATVCAKFGLECCIYMGEKDCDRQALNVFRMKMLGATVVAVKEGGRTLKDAVNAAMRDWVTNISTTHFLVGSAIGPHPFPTIVREFQSVIGKETKRQMFEKAGKLPDAVVACVGGGSNAIGMFHAFVQEKTVRIIGVEAGGDGLSTERHAATLTLGTPGVFHGTCTYLLQDSNGQVSETTCISAGLDYPGVGPEHSYLKEIGRAEYRVANDAQCLLGFRKMTQLEGIIPALESSHAIYAAIELAKDLPKDKDIVICLSGRGDKDMHNVAEVLPKLGPQIGWDLRF